MRKVFLLFCFLVFLNVSSSLYISETVSKDVVRIEINHSPPTFLAEIWPWLEGVGRKSEIVNFILS